MSHRSLQRNYPWNIYLFLEDLFLGGQWSNILDYRRLSAISFLSYSFIVKLSKFYLLMKSPALSSYSRIVTVKFIIHQEVASDSFCFLINCSWLLVFIQYVFSLFLTGFNLYCWQGINFS